MTSAGDQFDAHSKGEILVRQLDNVASVVISNPGKFNAMTRQMWVELRSHFLEFQNSANLRCITIHGAAGNFCAGGDIAEYPGFRFTQSELQKFHEEEVWGALQAMLNCDVPVVAQIEGNCMGAGVEIASCCDLRIASAMARFGAPIARLGFPMAPKEAALVTRSMGETTARAMLLAAEVFGSHHMYACGWLTSVCADGVNTHAVHDEVSAIAHRIRQLGPQAARLNKRTLRSLCSCSSPADGPYAYAESAEHREGVQAFLEKRKPQF